MPGERFSAASRPIIDYLKFIRHFEQEFPGFESGVHGLQHGLEEAAQHYSVDCICP
ncbi:hypothetical protein D3C71_2223140 [compost metagenome]